ncbi:tRNA (uracil(54)-C(5))-methyltransferase SCDLUD_002620 [Saccharomycodes ludwigii]|uniref:tRNA (uracil(54)-C(5))-methyltransferase n=1 Tax=Saccharomycodes ludwigii TaxID=36035 RepID=UPI001E885FC5|nr:hypothetical protein SCDLUD_002620 [Saccharomycodes ludwigii]KAH3901138.1 hypothetical protein SCDLUD_002620 [Saccharomycodes ludwigii]
MTTLEATSKPKITVEVANEEKNGDNSLKRSLTPQNKDEPHIDKKKYKRAVKVNNGQYKKPKIDATGPIGVLDKEITSLIRAENLTSDSILNDVAYVMNNKDNEELISQYHRVEENVRVLRLTSSGEGMAIVDHPLDKTHKQVVIIPFSIPGDVVKARLFKTLNRYVQADLLEITTPSLKRNDERITCKKYFGSCSGCQYQMMDYDEQLRVKRKTVENAYKYFAPEIFHLLPEVGDTVGSPLQFNYRTKLTPHFDLPRRYLKMVKRGELEKLPKLALGFGCRGKPEWRKTEGFVETTRHVIDIEECSIGTKILNIGLTNERRAFKDDYVNYRKGGTILLRENTNVLNKNATEEDIQRELTEGSRNEDTKISYIEEDVSADKKLVKTCVTDTKQVVSEYINGLTFKFVANEFFQNNDSILPLVIDYVKQNLMIPNVQETEARYLVDAYCGSGLFSISCSQDVEKVIGVEVSADSVKMASKNAERNSIKNCTFLLGKAECIFESIDTPSDFTSVILDPPRKGCDEIFLRQLAAYNPAKIVYISCNVHSQARDVQYFLTETENGCKYKVESIRGFDFFPQTHHVEGVCVLSRL